MYAEPWKCHLQSWLSFTSVNVIIYLIHHFGGKTSWKMEEKAEHGI